MMSQETECYIEIPYNERVEASALSWKLTLPSTNKVKKKNLQKF